MGVCKSCGGMVDEKGYAMGGEINDDDMAPGGLDSSMDGPLGDRMGQETEQEESGKMLRAAAFADALRGRMSRRGMDDSTPEEPSEPLPGEDDEMTKAKKARYGFMGRR